MNFKRLASPTSLVLDSDRYIDEYSASFVDKYDELIDWNQRAKQEGNFFERMLRAGSCETILDAATGTGYYAITLARAGFSTIASDGSREMVRKARENAKRMGVELEVYEADWRRLSEKVSVQVDALLCLGNAFAHLFNAEDRALALSQFYHLVRPGGLVIIDHRNFDAVLQRGCLPARGCHYCCDRVDVCVENMTTEAVRLRYSFPDGSVHRLEMYPLKQDELAELMERSGFRMIGRYGQFEPEFQLLEPDVIVQVGKKELRRGEAGRPSVSKGPYGVS